MGYFDTLDEATKQQVTFKEEIHPDPESLHYIVNGIIK